MSKIFKQIICDSKTGGNVTLSILFWGRKRCLRFFDIAPLLPCFALISTRHQLHGFKVPAEILIKPLRNTFGKWKMPAGKQVVMVLQQTKAKSSVAKEKQGTYNKRPKVVQTPSREQRQKNV